MGNIEYVFVGLYILVCLIIIYIPIKKLNKQYQGQKQAGLIAHKAITGFKLVAIMVFLSLLGLVLILNLSAYEKTPQLFVLFLSIFLLGIWMRIYTRFVPLANRVLVVSGFLSFTAGTGYLLQLAV